MTAILPYETGTASVAADGTIVTGVGTIWSGTNAKPGDQFSIGHFSALIVDNVDATHLKITPWPGSTISGADYSIWPNYPMRVAGAQAMQTVNDLVAAFNTSGFFIFVDVGLTAPDPSLGDDGQYAFQPTTGKTWAKVAGVWSYLGIYKGFNFRGAYDNAATYSYGDVQTTSGSSYVYINATPSAGHAAPNPTYWQLMSSVGPAGNTGPAGAGYGGTSTTSRTIGMGSQAFTTQAGLAYQNGARVRASSAANAANYMEGLATYSGTTLTINVTATGGSGTLADWNFNLAGQPGVGDMLKTDNLSGLANVGIAANNLGVVSYAASQSLTGANKTQAQQNIGIPGIMRGYIDGLIMSTPGASTTITIGAGVAVDDTGTDVIILPTSINKVTSSWVATTNGGGLDTGTIAPNTWYHFFSIKNSTSGAGDVVFSLSATAPTVPSGYTPKRRIGSAKTDASSQWLKFTQVGNEFHWSANVAELAAVAPANNTGNTITLAGVPPGVNVEALFHGACNPGASANGILFTSLDEVDVGVLGLTGGRNASLWAQTPGSFQTGDFRKRTNALAQIRWRVYAAQGDVGIYVYGWVDARGRDS